MINGSSNLAGHVIMTERRHHIEVPVATRELRFEWSPNWRHLHAFCQGETVGLIVACDVATPADAHAISIVFANGWAAALRHHHKE